jgi:hypothetical protein
MGERGFYACEIVAHKPEEPKDENKPPHVAEAEQEHGWRNCYEVPGQPRRWCGWPPCSCGPEDVPTTFEEPKP